MAEKKLPTKKCADKKLKAGLSFGHFSGNLRLVDLPEFWGFLAFFLEFWENSWVFGQLLGNIANLEKLCPKKYLLNEN